MTHEPPGTARPPDEPWRAVDELPPALAPEEIHVWSAELDLLHASLPSLRSLLSADERARADRFDCELERARYTAARGTLRSLLAFHLKCAPAAVAFEYGPHGKPGLRDAGIQFNLSHSGSRALFAFAFRRRLGIDLEQHQPGRDTPAIARRFFSPAEMVTLDGLEESARTAAFYRGWTRKEAYLKALGTGLSSALASFDVTLAPDEPARILATRPDPLETARWWLTSLPLGPGWSSALAAEAPAPRLRLFQVTEALLQQAQGCRSCTQSDAGR